MRFFRTSHRDLFAAFFSLTAALLHTICCLLPLYTSFAVAFGKSFVWKTAQPYLLAAQVLVLLYCIFRIVAAYPKPFKARIYMISAVIGLAGIGLGMRDTIRSREQAQAVRILENLKYQESVTLAFPGRPELPEIRQALTSLKGVRWEKTAWGTHGLTVHYHSGMVSEEQVLRALAREGYRFEKVLP